MPFSCSKCHAQKPSSVISDQAVSDQ